MDKIAIINLGDEPVDVEADHIVAYGSHGRVVEPGAEDVNMDCIAGGISKYADVFTDIE